MRAGAGSQPAHDCAGRLAASPGREDGRRGEENGRCQGSVGKSPSQGQRLRLDMLDMMLREAQGTGSAVTGYEHTQG